MNEISSTGATTFGAVNTYTGQTFINYGVVTTTVASTASGGPLGNNSYVTFGNNTGVELILDANLSVGALAGGGGTMTGINLNGNILTIGGNVISGTYSSTFSGKIFDTATGGGITKTSGDTEVLSFANTYSGATTVSAGILQAGVAWSGTAGAGGAFGLNSAVSVAGDAELFLNNDATEIGSLTGLGNVVLGSATLTVGSDNTSPAAFGGTISGTGGLTKLGTGTLTLSGLNTYTGATTVQQGTLSVSNLVADRKQCRHLQQHRQPDPGGDAGRHFDDR